MKCRTSGSVQAADRLSYYHHQGTQYYLGRPLQVLVRSGTASDDRCDRMGTEEISVPIFAWSGILRR